MRIMRVIKRRNKIVFWSLFYKKWKCDVFWVEGFFFIWRLWNHMTDSRVVRVYRGSQSWINMIIINHTVLWCNIEYNSYIMCLYVLTLSKSDDDELSEILIQNTQKTPRVHNLWYFQYFIIFICWSKIGLISLCVMESTKTETEGNN